MPLQVGDFYRLVVAMTLLPAFDRVFLSQLADENIALLNLRTPARHPFSKFIVWTSVSSHVSPLTSGLSGPCRRSQLIHNARKNGQIGELPELLEKRSIYIGNKLQSCTTN